MVHAKVVREPELEAHGDGDDARVLIVIGEEVYVTVLKYPTFRPLQAPQFEKSSKDITSDEVSDALATNSALQFLLDPLLHERAFQGIRARVTAAILCGAFVASANSTKKMLVTLLAHTTGASASELHKHSTVAYLWRALTTSVVLPGDERNLQSILGYKLQACVQHAEEPKLIHAGITPDGLIEKLFYSHSSPQQGMCDSAAVAKYLREYVSFGNEAAMLAFLTNMFDTIGPNSNASHALSKCIKSVGAGVPARLDRSKMTQKLAWFLSTISHTGIVSMLHEVRLPSLSCTSNFFFCFITHSSHCPCRRTQVWGIASATASEFARASFPVSASVTGVKMRNKRRRNTNKVQLRVML